MLKNISEMSHILTVDGKFFNGIFICGFKFIATNIIDVYDKTMKYISCQYGAPLNQQLNYKKNFGKIFHESFLYKISNNMILLFT